MGIWQASITAAQILVGAAGQLIDFGNHVQPGVGYTLAFLLAASAAWAAIDARCAIQPLLAGSPTAVRITALSTSGQRVA